MTVRDMTLVALFAALTAVCAQVSLTLPFVTSVPFTLQVFAVLAAGAILGARRAFLSQVVYILLGGAGLPVFARLHGGTAVLMGPTGGYLWAYPLAALVVGGAADIAAQGRERKSFLTYVYPAMGAGILVIYGLGAVGLILAGVVHTLPRAVQVGVLPFFWFDLLKAYLAGVVAVRVRSAILPAGREAAGQSLGHTHP